MYVRNLSGIEYALQATATHDSEINGNRTLSLTILPTKVNNVFIEDIAEMWVITDDDDVAHKVVYAKRQGVGNTLIVDIKAVPLFFDDFDNLRIYEEYNQHMTAMAAFTLIFSDTDYNFVLHDSHDAVDWEGFGAGETRLETFKRALNRYGAEFEISGNTIHLKALIGRDTQFQYRHRLNASNIVQEIDASGFWTYAKGYGDFGDGEGGGDWQDAKLIREYTSPLATILGTRHAPPIKDGRVSVVSAMDKALKTLVDDSLKVSVSTDIHDLRKQGYALAQPQLGDRVFLTDERIGFDEEVRVVAMSITKDWRGNVTHFSITIGDEGVTKRYQSNLSTAIDNITNIVNGTQKLPYSVLDNAVLQATKALQNAQTELTFNTNGILAIDKLDPNNVTILNSAGVGVSTDGGATFGQAITGQGINASYIVTGVLDAGQVVVRGGNDTNYTHIQGSTIESSGRYPMRWKNVSKTIDASLYMANGNFRVANWTDERSIFITPFGFSTFADGYGDGTSSGMLEFFSEEFESNTHGITLASQLGIAGIKSFQNRVFMDAYASVNVESRQSSVYFRPYKDNRPGNNTFAMTVVDAATSSATDGILFYGSDVGGYGAGLRFSKAESNMTVAVTDGNGARGGNATLDAGIVRANRITKRDGSQDVYFNGSGGGTLLLSSNPFIADGVRSSASALYLGVDEEVRVTNGAGYNNGSPVVYRPIRAREFITDTSIRENKRNIDVYNEDVLEIIRKGNAYLYNRTNEISHTKKQLGLMLDEMPYETYSERGDGFGIYGLVGFLFRGLKQAVEEIDKLKGVS